MRRRKRSADTSPVVGHTLRRMIARVRDGSDDHGSASLELIGAGVILLVPLVYLIIALSHLQAGAFAVEAAAGVFVRSGSEADARASAERAIEFAFADYGLDAQTATVDVSCEPVPTSCLERRGYVTVFVRADVALPLVPAILATPFPASIPVEASATQRVSRFWSGG
jgi:hypothetical protein